MIVPEEFVVQKFYQHAGYPKYVKSTNTYTGGCPICREGSSWGRKSRCYYIPKDTAICCHNCGWYGKPVSWVMEIEGIDIYELTKQIENCDFEYGVTETVSVIKDVPELPADSINIFDKQQLNYYKNEQIVITAAKTVVNRRLNVAVNRPKSLYVSLSDYVHKNRLIIPFYERSHKCIFYQSRTLLANDHRPKYLSKQNSEKSLFNYNNVSSGSDHVFVTEGPIDSFFIKNSVAVAGIQERSQTTFTPTQQAQLDRLFLMQTVWVLDSQWQDEASLRKSEILLKNGSCVFLWPENVGKQFKDVNEMCVYFQVNEITSDYILEHTYCGLKGIVKLKQIK